MKATSLIFFLVLFSLSSFSDDSAHWTYDDTKNGPSDWGNLQSEFGICGSGADQSPIDLGNNSKESLQPIRFFYRPSKLHFVNNGHTIQANVDPGSFIRLGSTSNEERYELLQFHFHTPSEHMVATQGYEMELHLVHKNAAGKLAVIGVFISKGKRNEVFKPLWENLPEAGDGKVRDYEVYYNPENFLPQDRRFFRYAGSLTTPPCSEGVNWNVLSDPIQLSMEQIDRFRNFYKMNARPVQPIKGRKISLAL